MFNANSYADFEDSSEEESFWNEAAFEGKEPKINRCNDQIDEHDLDIEHDSGTRSDDDQQRNNVDEGDLGKTDQPGDKLNSARKPGSFDEETNVSVDVGRPENLGPYNTFEDAEKVMHNFARSKLFKFCYRRTKVDKATRKRTYGMLFCDRGREPPSKRMAGKASMMHNRNGNSKRRECPLQFSVGRHKVDKKFYIRVGITKHNHELSTNYLKHHSSAKRLTKEHKNFADILTSAGVKPMNILTSLKKHFNDAKNVGRKNIYNEIQQQRKSDLGDLTAVQSLLSLLSSKETYCDN